MKNKFNLILASFVLAIFLIGNVFALAVSCMYWEENPLTLNPKETKEIKVVLRNQVDPTELELNSKITEGQEIAEFVEGTSYIVPGKSTLDVPIKVTCPENAKAGQLYNITLTFTTVSGEGNILGFASSVEWKIPVSIIKSEEGENKVLLSWIIYLGILIISIGIIIYFLREYKSFKKKKKV